MSEFGVGHVVSAQEVDGESVRAIQPDGFVMITDTGFFVRGVRDREDRQSKWALQFGDWQDGDITKPVTMLELDELEAALWRSLVWHGRELAGAREVEGVVLPNAFIITSSSAIMVLAREYERTGGRNWRLYECSGAEFGKIEALMHGQWSMVDSAREALHSALRLAKVTIA